MMPISFRSLTAKKKEKLSCIVVSLPEDIKGKISKWAKKNIKEEDLFYIDDKRGLENHLHITVKYGLYTNDSDEVKAFLKKQDPVEIRLGPISKFRDISDEFDILKIEAYGSDLQDFNKAISKEFDHKKQRNKYLPHITLAYVKKDACEDLIGGHKFEDEKITGSRFVFLDDDSEPTTIQIKASRVDYVQEDLPAEFWDKKGSTYILKPEVEKFIYNRVTQSLSKVLKGIDTWLLNLIIGSSIATQFWKDDSDLDIKVVMNEKAFKEANPQFSKISGEKLTEAILEVFDKFKGKDFFSYGKHPMELYPAMSGELSTEDFLKRFDALYDIKNKRWIKDPKLIDVDTYDRDEVVMEGEEMAMEFAVKWDMDIGKIKRKLKELELVIGHLKHLSPARRLKFRDKIEHLKDGLTKDIQNLHKEKQEVKQEYNDAYKSYDADLEKYYGSVNSLPEVIRIKMLNMWGYIKLIKELNKLIEDGGEVESVDVPKIKELVSAGVISSRQFYK